MASPRIPRTHPLQGPDATASRRPRRRPTTIAALAAALCIAASSGCGSSTPAPTPSTGTSHGGGSTGTGGTNTGTPANVAGNWTGTLSAAGLPTRTVTMLAFQGGTCVDGAWKTEPDEWTGAVSGLADATSFTGSVSFQRPADGPGKCGGIATFSGPVGADTLTWTSTGFTGDCPGGLPQSVTLTLRRQ